MRLVIDIPETLFNRIKRYVDISVFADKEGNVNSVRVDGIDIPDFTALPKKHGRLIDAYKYKQELWRDISISCICGIERAEDRLNIMPTIIEADMR